MLVAWDEVEMDKNEWFKRYLMTSAYKLTWERDVDEITVYTQVFGRIVWAVAKTF